MTKDTARYQQLVREYGKATADEMLQHEEDHKDDEVNL